jgi:hypothetical protein
MMPMHPAAAPAVPRWRQAIAARARGAFVLGLALVLAPALGACSGLGSLSTANQVIVHLDQNPNDLAAAQRVADDTCRRRGGRARFIARLSSDEGSHDVRSPAPPDAVFICDPAS